MTAAACRLPVSIVALDGITCTDPSGSGHSETADPGIFIAAGLGAATATFPAAIVSHEIMNMPVYITFRDLATDATLDALIRERAEGLVTAFNRIQSCHVLVEVPHRHHRSGNRYHVRIEIAVPGDTLVVSHHPSLDRSARHAADVLTKSVELDAEHKNAAIVIREAFDIARRRLQEYGDRRNSHSHVKV